MTIGMHTQRSLGRAKRIPGVLAAVLCLRNIPLATDPDTPMWSSGSGMPGVPRRALLSIVSIGLAGVAVLAGGLIVIPGGAVLSAAVSGLGSLKSSAAGQGSIPTGSSSTTGLPERASSARRPFTQPVAAAPS